MSSQNPIFIPGPTNIPEALRKAVDMPTLDHRSPVFANILRPALRGVKKVLKSECRVALKCGMRKSTKSMGLLCH